jgi:aspartate/methionine/tyrosine aminotransferase
MINYPLKDLGVSIENLEITRPPQYGFDGYEPLLTALAAKAKVFPKNIVTATGTSMANHLVMAALLQPGDEVVIEQPTYEPLVAVIRYLKARPISFQRRFEDRFRVDPAEIKRKLNSKVRLIVLTNLNNPTGVQASLETLQEVGEVANSAGARVLVDEVYLEAFSNPESYYAHQLGNHFVTTSSLTKAYGLSGLRCGWIVADPELAQKMWKLNDLFGVMPPHTAELLSVVALQKLDQIAERSRSLLKANWSLLQKFFEEHDQLEVVIPPGGTIAFPKLKSGNTDQFTKLLAEKYDTGVVPGKFFGMPDHFRIGIGCLTETLAEGLKRMDSALHDFAHAAR